MNPWSELEAWLDTLQSSLDGRPLLADLPERFPELEARHEERLQSVCETLATTGAIPELTDTECTLLALRLHWAATVCGVLGDAERAGLTGAAPVPSDRVAMSRFLLLTSWQACGAWQIQDMEHEFLGEPDPG